MITVVAALLTKDDKILLAKRLTGDKQNVGKWEFPGGKVQEGESEFNAIEREIKEELSIDIKANKFIINNICEYPTKKIDLRLYDCTYIGGKISLNDHSKYCWVSKEDILKYDLAKADIPLAKYLKEKN